jgi:heme oxygenase
LDKHATDPALAPTYNPHLLGRKAPLSADISTLLGVSEVEWPAHPTHAALLAAPPPPLSAYTAHLHALSATQPALLLAHAYVRYLGDLSGGQVLRRRVAKAYALDADGAGVEFYAFGSLAGARVGNAGDLLKLKVWFREGIDAADADARLKRACSRPFTACAQLTFPRDRLVSSALLSFR